MYAVVEIKGEQFKVSEGDIIDAPLMDSNKDEELEFDKILMLQDNDDYKVGTPYVDGAKVTVKVVSNVKGKKIIVFKYKRRKTFRKKQGHRQKYTRLLVEKIQAA